MASLLNPLAKIAWDDPQTGEHAELLLTEGAALSIGRLETNDISLREQHVSRQHAVINYNDGIFMITDLGSANGVYVNDARISEPYPLIAGDIIRLYVPTLQFHAAEPNEEPSKSGNSTLITAIVGLGKGRLIVTNGAQEGTAIPLIGTQVTVGRATTKADWEVCLQDPSVSRPHARMEYRDDTWVLSDLSSSNGTMVNGSPVTEKGRVIKDGDVITFGTTVCLFREL